MGEKSLLLDATRCIGCRSCQVSCKEWNRLPAERTRFFGGDGYQNPPDLTDRTWTLITYREVRRNGTLHWVFSKRQCMHCRTPSCVSVCPVGAMHKSEEGAVIYDEKKCIGCRYCMLACPFQVPKFEWSKTLPEIRKCTLCHDRIVNGLEPSCSAACPTGSIQFGERDKLIRTAELRISKNPERYFQHIYGKEEIGGTSILHLSPVPFEQVGFRTDLGNTPPSFYTGRALKLIPGVVVGLALFLGGAYLFTRRTERIRAMEEKNEDNKG